MRHIAPIALALSALGGSPALAQYVVPGGAVAQQREPYSPRASNITPQDTHSQIAPRLPTPPGGQDATVRRYLLDAQQALHAGRSGEAQEALERAETRLLDRTTLAGRANTPDANPRVRTITDALHALAAGNRTAALQIVDAALAEPAGVVPRGYYPARPAYPPPYPYYPPQPRPYYPPQPYPYYPPNYGYYPPNYGY